MEFINKNLYDSKRIEEHVFNMETKGYDVFENYFNEEICQYLEKKLEETIDQFVPFANSERSILDKYLMHDLLNRDITFAKTLEDSRLDQVIEASLCKNWIMYAYTSSSLPPNGNNFGSRIHVDAPRWIPNYPTNLGIMWALNDFTIENGATFALPGSHNSEKKPTPEVFEKNHTRLTCKKGSMVVFNARLWHRAGENTTNNFRHALTMNVCRPYMKQRVDWVRFIPTEITDSLNNQARRIIGFDTRLCTNLEEFFQPEEKRLYKANQE